jgi:hypothetical protein
LFSRVWLIGNIFKTICFNKKENKRNRGFAVLNPKQKSPGFKIPSHFINGLLTVILEDQQESKCRPWWQLQLGSVAQRKQNVLKNTRQS